MDKFSAVAQMLRNFSGWTNVTADDLRTLFCTELGAETALGEGILLKNCRRVAIPPQSVLLVCAGTLPQPSWQALARLALVEAKNVFIKLPNTSCAEQIVEAAQWLVQRGLFSNLEASQDLPDERIHEFDVVIVYGNNDTIAHFRQRVSCNAVFIGYGEKISIAIVNRRDVNMQTATNLVKDVLTNGHRGCLAPHLCFVCAGDSKLFAQYCARAFSEQSLDNFLNPSHDIFAAACVYTTRQTETALGSEIFLPEDGSLLWTVVASRTKELTHIPLHNVILIKYCSCCEELIELLKPWRGSISTVGLSNHQSPIQGLGATRFCSVGQMQQPSLFWTQDGFCSLQKLVTWISYEMS